MGRGLALLTSANLILLTVYSKSDQEDIYIVTIQGIIEDIME
ncbi:hypothetical protein ACOWPH_26630 [Anabaena sp. PCC 7938]|uniref:Uncharacterized protein n=1 Tax=Anabaena cylindrica (strain ATCC 27899 / PCC 7122) TaxID=272123 RepID=K9ZDL2_ANACC|nr:MULTISPECIES: hypothetical protein [Anabaena]AFZ56470.1 hypothetical protein Anacy_0893 [Anabaena cylindrica PCC 7122]BAY01084.1 hypothetical protein NIES19_03140 [Anabaena cylindrica PCC 7122]